MKYIRRPVPSLHLATVALGLALLPAASAQFSKVVFSEDFNGATIDSSKFAPDAPFFEGGQGDIAATQHDGVVQFTGTVNQQWWAGATLRVIPTFTASPETNIVVSVDRVSELGVGTSSRSALWIEDITTNMFVLFADNRGENHWEYNRKINEAGDQPTGGGTAIATFNNDPTFLDEGLHTMKAVANGSTVKLYLDDVFGAEVKFPVSQLLFQIGSYARANGDTADTTFDNLKVEEVGTATFSTTALTLGSGQTATGIKVRIPQGANASSAVSLRVVSSNPAAAIPVGASGDTLTLNFPAGGSNEQTIDVQSVAVGGSTLTLANDLGLGAGNTLKVTVVPGPGVRLTDDFSANTIDATKWVRNDNGFETGSGTFDVAQTGGQLQISGIIDIASYWGGASLKTVDEYIATPDLPLVFDMDRVSIDNLYYDTPATGARTGVFITTADRSQFVFFGQDLGETGWEVNVNPGNPTGSGTALAAFSALATDQGSHHLKMVADGSTVEVFLDGVSGGKFDFPVSSGIHFEVGAYARDVSDYVGGVFDNVKIENVLPCISVSPSDISTVQGDASNLLTITIPKLLNAVNTTVTITSSAPGVAIPQGAVNGKLDVVFPPGSASVKTVPVVTTGTGTAQFTFSNDQGVCLDATVNLTVTPPPVVLSSDDFTAGNLDTGKWTLDPTPLVDGGTATAESAVAVADGMVAMTIASSSTNWPGFTVWTKQTFDASADSPVQFEIDRVKMDIVLGGGTDSKDRTGIWVKDAAGHYVFFSDLGSFNGVTRGWQYHRFIDQADDVLLGANPDTTGTYIAAFNGLSDDKNHRLRATANGSTVKLYLDDKFGVEVPFPFAQGLTFGFGSYVNYANDSSNLSHGYWDNAVIKGFAAAAPQLSVSRTGADIVISWTGSGTLQSADALGNTSTWTDVSPAPTGNSYTITAAAQATQKFYRLRQ